MTIPANSAAEATPWGSIPVTPVWCSQGCPYNVAGTGTNAFPVQGPDAAGSAQTGRPVPIGGADGSGNVQVEQLNQNLTLLASATRTTTTSSSPQTNQNLHGVVVFLNVTAASGTGGLVVRIQMQDPVSGTWASLNAAPTAVTATGLATYAVYPNIAAGFNQQTNTILPTNWRVQVTHNDSSNYTYSVGASVLN